MDNINSANFKYFDIITGLFVAILIISEITAAKLFRLGSLTLPGAFIIFPISYIFGDVLTEVYGYQKSRRVIWTGFASLLLLSIILWIVQLLPPAASWPNQQAYDVILGIVPRITGASIIGYWAGEFANSYILAKLKLATKGRLLWTRTIGSTVVGQAVDTVIFLSAAYYGTIPNPVLLSIIASLYLFKVAYETIATPLTYLVVNYLKKAEGRDTYDYHTNFNPFRLN